MSFRTLSLEEFQARERKSAKKRLKQAATTAAKPSAKPNPFTPEYAASVYERRRQSPAKGVQQGR